MNINDKKKKTVRIAGNRDEIQNGYLPNISLECCSYSNLHGCAQLTHWRWGTQMCVFYLLIIENGGCRYAFLRMSQLMLSLPSVSDVRNYMNVWSGSIMFSPPNINIVCLQASTVTLSFTLVPLSNNGVC
jgi:hypothetical protein